MADFGRTAEGRKVSDWPKIFRLKSRRLAENISFENDGINKYRHSIIHVNCDGN